jgi:hypothetical protein
MAIPAPHIDAPLETLASSDTLPAVYHASMVPEKWELVSGKDHAHSTK